MPCRAAPPSLLTLVFGLLPVLLGADHSIADDRVLRVHDGAAARAYPVAELTPAIGLTKLRVAEDPHFGPDRVFVGFALEPLLKHIGLGDEESGYTSDEDLRLLGKVGAVGTEEHPTQGVPVDWPA